jgi:hypothetical protein
MMNEPGERHWRAKALLRRLGFQQLSRACPAPHVADFFNFAPKTFFMAKIKKRKPETAALV